MRFFYTKIFCCLLLFSGKNAIAQHYLSGTVYDSSRNNLIPGVEVKSTSGLSAITDSSGHYQLLINDGDSVFFIYNNKPTKKFSVQTIVDPTQFDIALKIIYKGKYKTLKEVILHTKTYRQDSIENRQAYADVFDYEKPGIKTSITPGGTVGMDIDELINLFRFKRNKRLKAFQQRLEAEEQEKYVNYRFNKSFVQRLTHLEGEQLNIFLLKYRPTYDFVSNVSELEFNQYILNASYAYKLALLQQNEKPQLR